MTTLLLAVGLVLILEGILPFAAPSFSRETWRRLIGMTDGQLRFVGLASVLSGLAILLVFW
jgi:hypothetical protein